MRKVILDEDKVKVVKEDDLETTRPIFAKRDGRLVGMVVREPDGWITRIGGNLGATGNHHTRQECIRFGMDYGLEYFVEDLC